MYYIEESTRELVTELDIRNRHPDYPFAFSYIPPSGYAVLLDNPQPPYNKYTHKLKQGDLVKTDDGHYEYSWNLIELVGEELNIANKQKIQDDEALNQSRISTLWQSAHNYEYSFISGSAINIVFVGVSKKLPKAVAVSEWINSIWGEYYIRKADISNYDLDFSKIGPCPFKVPELVAEQQ